MGSEAITRTPTVRASPRTAPSEAITLMVDACDPLTAVGTLEMLRPVPGVTVLRQENGQVADVALVLVNVIDGPSLVRVRRAHAVNHRPVVLVTTTLDEESALAAVEAGARAILRRSDVTAQRLAEHVRSAVRGDGALPSDILGRLLDRVGRLHTQVLLPLGLRLNGLTERELEVLRLVAEGLDTAEIAERLSYSQRTIKAVLHDVTMRLNLRNRTHAVAYAVKEGLI